MPVNGTGDTESNKAKRPRSPNFPFVPLGTAIQRLVSLEGYFGRHAIPANKAGLAWQMKGDSSQAGQTLAALKAFGLIEYSGSGDGLQATLTDDARTYLRAQQESIKMDVVRRAAGRPKLIALYLERWGADRPPDPICLDELVLKGGFTEAAAEGFLKVYDGTIGFAKLYDSDKNSPYDAGEDSEEAPQESILFDPVKTGQTIKAPEVQIAPSPHNGRGAIMEGERELTTGLLSKGASFRLLVSGEIGEKEIERLIKKLELDKEILAEVASGEGQAA